MACQVQEKVERSQVILSTVAAVTVKNPLDRVTMPLQTTKIEVKNTIQIFKIKKMKISNTPLTILRRRKKMK